MAGTAIAPPPPIPLLRWTTITEGFELDIEPGVKADLAWPPTEVTTRGWKKRYSFFYLLSSLLKWNNLKKKRQIFCLLFLGFFLNWKKLLKNTFFFCTWLFIEKWKKTTWRALMVVGKVRAPGLPPPGGGRNEAVFTVTTRWPKTEIKLKY